MNQNDKDPLVEHMGDDLMIMIVRRILEDKPLSEVDVENFQRVFFNMAFFSTASEQEMKIRIRKFDQAISNFLTRISKVLKEFEKSNHRMVQMVEDSKKEAAALPKHAFFWDHPDVIEFIRSLKDDLYSFSAAERLVGTTRQTLLEYAEKNKHGLQIKRIGKSKMLAKEDLINYYREKYHKDWGFTEHLEATQKGGMKKHK